MSDQRFTWFNMVHTPTQTPVSVIIVDVPKATFSGMDETSRAQHTVVKISIGGMISKQLAETWADQICSQLNQFDAANVTVAKLT